MKVNLGELEFTPEIFCDQLNLEGCDHVNDGCDGKSIALVANYELRKRLKKAPEVFLDISFDHDIWFENKGYNLESNDKWTSAARLVCIEKINES
jgi:hypothetical protein